MNNEKQNNEGAGLQWALDQIKKNLEPKPTAKTDFMRPGNAEIGFSHDSTDSDLPEETGKD